MKVAAFNMRIPVLVPVILVIPVIPVPVIRNYWSRSIDNLSPGLRFSVPVRPEIMSRSITGEGGG